MNQGFAVNTVKTAKQNRSGASTVHARPSVHVQLSEDATTSSPTVAPLHGSTPQPRQVCPNTELNPKP